MEHPLHLFKYCPKCGSERFVANNGKSNRCQDCGFVYYFNPSASTVAFILDGKGNILVCRRAKDPQKGTLDLPGGFIDMEETGEQGIVREIMEETGLEVSNVKYLFSLPNTYLYSGFLVHTLDLFYICEITEGNASAKAMDDVAETFWIPINQINANEFGLDSIREGITRFLKQYNMNYGK